MTANSLAQREQKKAEESIAAVKAKTELIARTAKAFDTTAGSDYQGKLPWIIYGMKGVYGQSDDGVTFGDTTPAELLVLLNTFPPLGDVFKVRNGTVSFRTVDESVAVEHIEAGPFTSLCLRFDQHVGMKVVWVSQMADMRVQCSADVSKGHIPLLSAPLMNHLSGNNLPVYGNSTIAWPGDSTPNCHTVRWARTNKHEMHSMCAYFYEANDVIEMVTQWAEG